MSTTNVKCQVEPFSCLTFFLFNFSLGENGGIPVFHINWGFSASRRGRHGVSSVCTGQCLRLVLGSLLGWKDSRDHSGLSLSQNVHSAASASMSEPPISLRPLCRAYHTLDLVTTVDWAFPLFHLARGGSCSSCLFQAWPLSRGRAKGSLNMS